MYPDIAKESRFALSHDPLFFGNTCYFIPGENLFLLAILNSSAIWFYYSSLASVLGDSKKGGRLRWFTQDVMKLPIPRIEFKTREILENLVKNILGRKNQDISSSTISLEDELDKMIYQLYGLTEEEIRVVEGGMSIEH